MKILSNERWRISENETCVMVNGEDVVPENYDWNHFIINCRIAKKCWKNCNFEDQG